MPQEDSSSNKRAEASRLNGAQSKGPTSTEGKARSSQNALKFGLYTKDVIKIGPGDREQYECHVDQLIQALAPTDYDQLDLARTIADCSWKLRKFTELEAALIEKEIASHGAGLVVFRCSSELAILSRREAAINRQYYQARKELKALQKANPGTPLFRDASCPDDEDSTTRLAVSGRSDDGTQAPDESASQEPHEQPSENNQSNPRPQKAPSSSSANGSLPSANSTANPQIAQSNLASTPANPTPEPETPKSPELQRKIRDTEEYAAAANVEIEKWKAANPGQSYPQWLEAMIIDVNREIAECQKAMGN